MIIIPYPIVELVNENKVVLFLYYTRPGMNLYNCEKQILNLSAALKFATTQNERQRAETK